MVTLSWSVGESGTRTIVPAGYPTPDSYEVTAYLDGTIVASESGLSAASSSCTLTKLVSGVYTIRVNGLDSSGRILVTGSAEVDLTDADSANAAISLSYIVSSGAATGTGEIHLVFDFSGVSGVSAAVTLADPAGNVTHPTLGGASPTLTYDDSAAAVGSHRLFVQFSAGGQTALLSETVLVVQGVSTAATISLDAADFSAAYQPVSSVTLGSTSATAYVGDSPVALSASVAGSNPFVVWTSSNPAAATVSQAGLVAIVAAGSAAVRATSADDPTKYAECAVTVATLQPPASLNAADAGGFGSNSEITLSWPAAAGATSYNIYWSASPGVTVGTGTKIPGIASASYLHTGLRVGYTYYYIATSVRGGIETVATGAVSRYLTPRVDTLAGTAGDGYADGSSSVARFLHPVGVAADQSGFAYVADSANHRIRKLDSYGNVETYAGSGTMASVDGTGTGASFNYPTGIAIDGSGTLYVSEASHAIRKITAAGAVTTLAGTAGSSGSADGTGSVARFFQPEGVAVDSAGNVYVADTGNHTVRKITSAGVVTTLAGTAGSSGSVNGTGAAARFNGPRGVAVDSAGTVYVADTGNHTIRKITSAGVVTTLAGSAGSFGNVDAIGTAARFYAPWGIAIDPLDGVLFATENYEGLTHEYRIRRIAPDSAVTTYAGASSNGSSDGYGTAATFYKPTGIAVGTYGRLYVADHYNSMIRFMY